MSFPAGAEHNQWWLRHAEVMRPYEGSGVYEIKVDSAFTGYQQVGLSFESSPGTFMQFMLYSNGSVYAYAERFANVNGTQTKSTVAGASTGRAVPEDGPWYLRVTVDDDTSPENRSWKFQWSTDAVNWVTLTDGVLETAAPSQNAGAIQTVGVFTGNQPSVFSVFDARIDYFSSGSAAPSSPRTSTVRYSSSRRRGSLDLVDIGPERRRLQRLRERDRRRRGDSRGDDDDVTASRVGPR